MRLNQLYLLFIAVHAFASAFGQSQIVMSDDIYLVMDNSVYVVIDNPAANALATTGTGGNIVSEDELNIVLWNIGATIGNYTIPFTTAGGTKIPLELNISSAGTGAGSIGFSTYAGNNWDNDLYRPASVTNMTNMAALNNSAEVIDRFWIIEPNGYSIKPAGTMSFTYADAEHSAIGNTITEADLKAERYDEATDNWELYPVSGVVNTIANTVSAVDFNSLDFTENWTLLDQTSHILPVVLLSFTASCKSGHAEITWTTAQELNSDYFIIERSLDGDIFQYIATVDAAGSSQEEMAYVYFPTDNTPAYYRLTIVNANGSQEVLGVVFSICTIEEEGFVYAYTQGFSDVFIHMEGFDAGTYYLKIYAISGQSIYTAQLEIDNGENVFHFTDSKLASGMYLLHLSNGQSDTQSAYTKKILILTD